MTNNRIFKFRVWNTKTNKWVHGPGEEVNLLGETILLGAFMCGVGCMELNDCIPLQFTGLCDENKKEIYEGDILSWVADEKERLALWKQGLGMGDIAIVEYSSTKAAFISSIQSKFGGEGYEFLATTNYNWFVIGNIFENKNLLT